MQHTYYTTVVTNQTKNKRVGCALARLLRVAGVTVASLDPIHNMDKVGFNKRCHCRQLVISDGSPIDALVNGGDKKTEVSTSQHLNSLLRVTGARTRMWSGA